MAEIHASPPDPYRSPADDPARDAAFRSAADRHRTSQRNGALRGGPLLIGVLVVALLVLHQDYWFWRNDTLVFGWIPLGLFYHVCLSILASLVWILATKIAWPAETIRTAQLAGPAAATGPAASAGPAEESER